ncbi:MAG: hydrogenase maturation protease [Candidatus Hadarchaeum sp.]|uniref:hydrogenase maturation protease n=1 Tax=Candidatus Hadarchaeum sp. TaxID=2883567 RepID=UPI003D0FC715
MVERKLIVGLGNILLKDEGVGMRCVEFLRNRGLGRDVKIVDGATLGVDLLEEIKGFDRVVLVDAVDMGKEPGYIASFRAEELLMIADEIKFSLHEFNLVDVIKLGKQLGHDLSNVKIVGIQPKEVGWGDRLSNIIEEKLPELAVRVLSELED